MFNITVLLKQSEGSKCVQHILYDYSAIKTYKSGPNFGAGIWHSYNHTGGSRSSYPVPESKYQNLIINFIAHFIGTVM